MAKELWSSFDSFLASQQLPKLSGRQDKWKSYLFTLPKFCYATF
jgi:hypothetical protein